jgi:hypothetical protein
LVFRILSFVSKVNICERFNKVPDIEEIEERENHFYLIPKLVLNILLKNLLAIMLKN